MLRYVEEALAKRRAGDATVRGDADLVRRPRPRRAAPDFLSHVQPTSRRRDEKTTRAPLDT